MKSKKLESLSSEKFNFGKISQLKNREVDKNYYGRIYCTYKNGVSSDHITDTSTRDELIDPNGGASWFADVYNEPCGVISTTG